MYPGFSLSQLGIKTDTTLSGLETRIDRVSNRMKAGFPDAMHTIGVKVAQGIDQHIQDGIPPPLSPKTVAKRRARVARGGFKPVDGDEAQLRDSDQFREAATATDPTVRGTAYKETPHSVTIGADTTKGSPVFYAVVATGVSEYAQAHGIPNRDPRDVTEQDEADYRQQVANELDTMLENG